MAADGRPIEAGVRSGDVERAERDAASSDRDTTGQTAPDVTRSFGADPARSVRATITEATVEHAFAVIIAVVAIAFGTVFSGAFFAQLPHLDPVGGPVVAAAVGASFLFAGLSGVVTRFAQVAQVALASVFLVALLTWPLTVPHTLAAGQQPWPWWICNVATAAAAIGLSPWRAVVYNLVVPIVYVVIRVLPAGGEVGVFRAVIDGVYIAILGGAVVVLAIVLRRAAAAVDSAQSAAVRRYAHAIREHATEVERVQVDAIVHDSVLTTLLSAARADTPAAKALAAGMAANAINHLAAASADGPDEVPPVSLPTLRDRIDRAVSELAVPVVVRQGHLDARTVPASVADSLASAAIQAAVNSVQHAGDAEVGRWVVVTGVDDGVRVEVGDTGRGFDLDTVPDERLGVRRSIIERVAAVGGDARVLTAPGRGTRVILSWTPEQDDRHPEQDDRHPGGAA